MYSSMFKRSLSPTIIALTGLIFSSTAYGQGKPEQKGRPVLDPTAVCMSAPKRNVPQVSQASRGQAFRVVVAAQDVPALEEQGFTQVECRTADMNSRASQAQWRDAICETASSGNEAVQRQLERALGASPAHLCGSARVALGSD